MGEKKIKLYRIDLFQNSLKPPFLRGVGGINPFFCKRSNLNWMIIASKMLALQVSGLMYFHNLNAEQIKLSRTALIRHNRLKSLLSTGWLLLNIGGFID
jgi:hypothetical protein